MIYFKRHIISVCLLMCLFFAACDTGHYQLTQSKAAYPVIDSLVGSDASMEALIKPYRDSLNSEMQEVIGQSARELRGGFPESLLSNFVADLMLHTARLSDLGAGADISIVNVKGLRVPIPKGAVTLENIYQLMPFENELMYLWLSKQQVVALFNYMARVGGDGMGGASFGIKDACAVDIRVGGRPLEDRSYLVVTSDYLADGGDHFDVFLEAARRQAAGLKIRDAIIRHIRGLTNGQESINSKLDKRIYYAE